jgi:hypothetical protein
MGARCGLGFHQSSAGAGEILGQPHHHHDPQGKDRPLNLFSKECQQQERPLRNPAHAQGAGRRRRLLLLGIWGVKVSSIQMRTTGIHYKCAFDAPAHSIRNFTIFSCGCACGVERAGHFRFDPLNGGGADAAKLGSF